MTVSKHAYAAGAKVSLYGGELSASELDQVTGGDKVITIQQDVTLNKATTGQKAADAADAYIRG